MHGFLRFFVHIHVCVCICMTTSPPRVPSITLSMILRDRAKESKRDKGERESMIRSERESESECDCAHERKESKHRNDCYELNRSTRNSGVIDTCGSTKRVCAYVCAYFSFIIACQSVFRVCGAVCFCVMSLTFQEKGNWLWCPCRCLTAYIFCSLTKSSASDVHKPWHLCLELSFQKKECQQTSSHVS